MKVIKTIGVSFLLLMLITACDNPVMGPNGGTTPDGNVIIKIAGTDGRTILPQAPVFSKYELTLQKGSDEPIEVTNISGITGAGVAVQLAEGDWTITLKAYQDVLKNGAPVLAATGTAAITVQKGDRVKTVVITLNVPAIGETAEPGVFSYTVILPGNFDTAVLSLKDSDGLEVFNGDTIDLTIEENLSGSIALPSGYYDLSVIVTKDGQSAGLFESVHIYSGLESPATLDLSAVAFADKVYIMGTLDGIRLGTVTITSDAAGNNAIGTPFELGGSVAIRTANWIIDIPSSYVGQTVYAVQEFESVKSPVVPIPNVPVNGAWDVALSITPATPALFNVARWYAELTASGGEGTLAQVADGSMNTHWQSERGGNNGPVWLELDFGFNVDVNAAQLVFYSNSDTGSVLINEYNVEYWNGSNWVSLVHRSHALEGSTNGSIKYGDLFTTALPYGGAQKFRWIAPGNAVENAPDLIEFGLYKTADRAALSAAISLAQDSYDSTNISTDGADVSKKQYWVTSAVAQTYQAAINAASAVCNDLLVTQGAIDAALSTLNTATSAFEAARSKGTLESIFVTNFSVEDGYANKFVIKWSREPTYKYVLYMSSTDSSIGTQIAVFEGSTNVQMFTYEVVGIDAGQTRYFTMQPYELANDEHPLSDESGQPVSSGAKETMGVPVLSPVSSPSHYSTVSLSWTAVQRADAYKIVYSIAGDPASPHAVQVAANATTYSLTPNGYNNPIILGRQITIRVEAINNALYVASGCDVADVTTTSNSVTTRLVGPAELNATATQAAAADNIKLSWSPVEGAAGYYVFRRQFNLNNTAVANAETIAYYVPAGSGSITVTGKNIAPGDTTTTKATAAFANNLFTLTDSSMSDAEYNGAYSGYTAGYKNQQNELAWGNAYRYFIVPVVALTDTVAFNASGDNVPYTITSGSETITYNSVAALEKRGFTVGFGQNVTATKGTYASSGNVNDGIQVNWDAPPLLASAGVTPQYKVYGRGYKNANWTGWGEADRGSASSFIDVDDRGIVFEYVVGINGSNPTNFSRFMNESRAQLDSKGIPKGYGYMLDLVKLQGVSRTEIKVGNEFGEDVTFFNTGVNNGGTDKNWGVDGYTVYVMNRNINGSWHIIKDDVDASSSTDATQVVRVTTGMGTADGRDLLRVLRDYKHYFKVRSYVLNGGVKVYCPDPAWDYVTLFTANRNNQDTATFLETEYVKWGARQISAEEFVKAATLAIAWGLHGSAGTQRSSWWGTALSWTSTSNNGSSGRVGEDHSGSTVWWFYFDNYKPDLDTRANKDNWNLSTTFLTLNTKDSQSDITYSRRSIVGKTTVSYQYPHTYSADGNYGSQPILVTGPNCLSTERLYTGGIWLNGLTWGGGTIEVHYPTTAGYHPPTGSTFPTANITTNTKITTGGQTNTPLPFQSQSEDRRTVLDAWY